MQCNHRALGHTAAGIVADGNQKRADEMALPIVIVAVVTIVVALVAAIVVAVVVVTILILATVIAVMVVSIIAIALSIVVMIQGVISGDFWSMPCAQTPGRHQPHAQYCKQPCKTF